jgi:hypothetical protein
MVTRAAAALETLIILLAAGRAWQARARAASWAATTRSGGSRVPEYRGIHDDWPSAL